MHKKLRIISYNCQSFNTKSVIIKNLLESSDILCLQETFITDENSENFGKLDSNFVFDYTPAIRKPGVISGRPSAGLALFWRKSNDLQFFPVKLSDRFMGLKIICNKVTYLLINIYCYCDYGDMDSLIKYKTQMAELSNICEAECFDELLILGDTNADPAKGRFFPELKHFADSHSLFLPDIYSLPHVSYTYISPNATCSSSWIDHMVTSRADLTVNHEILYGSVFYDHIPIYCEMQLPDDIVFENASGYSPDVQCSISWAKANYEMKNNYKEVLDDLLRAK